MYTEKYLIRFKFLIFSFHSYKDNHYLTFMVALLRLFIKKIRFLYFFEIGDKKSYFRQTSEYGGVGLMIF